MTERLKIKKIVDKSAATLSPTSNAADIFECQFNPKTFTVSKGNDYDVPSAGQGRDISQLQFKGGKPQSMTIKLTFDSTDTGSPVVDLYATLRRLSKVDTSALDATTQLGEPPWVMVQWGSYIGFAAVITDLSEEYTFFKPDGTPLRSNVSVTLQQVSENVSSGAQNPTSRSEPRRTWVVEEGQRLDWIAYQEYGDSNAWRHIAEVNGLDDPHDLRSGQVLKLTPRRR